MHIDLLPYFFFLIALFYSSVGFGGGSSYLAILSLVFQDFHEIRTMALILNICVVSIGVFVSIRNRVFNWKLFWPFIVLSIPLAYLGASLRLSEKSFFLILGTALIFSGCFLLLRYVKKKIRSKNFNLAKRATIGGGVGFLAGLSGIGGGIFLSPVLNLLNWQNTRVVAALASFFILVNSISGLIGLQTAGTLTVNTDIIFKLIASVVAGGLLGSYLSHKKMNLSFIGILTAALVIYVGLRLVLMHGFGIAI